MPLNSILNHTRFISYGGVYCLVPIVYTLHKKKDVFLCEPRAVAMNICVIHYGTQPCPKWSHSL